MKALELNTKKKGIGLAIGIIIIVLFILIILKPAMRMLYPVYYKDIVSMYSQIHDVDPHLVTAIISVESNFRANAESNRGARGLMQVMPSTGQWVATEIGIDDYHMDMLYEPTINIKVGSWYLRILLEKFDFNLPVVLAAYNGGETNVRRWIQAKKWDGTIESVEDIPFPETRDYVKKVLIAYDRYKNLYNY